MSNSQADAEDRQVRRARIGVSRALACTFLSVLLTLVLGSSSALAATGHRFLSDLTEAFPGTSLSEPGAVAVDDTTGQVFVADPGNDAIYVYSSSGVYETQFGEGVEATSIAIDEKSGVVYVAEASQDVLVFKPNGSVGYELLSEWTGANAPGKSFSEVVGVAFDDSEGLSAGDLYIADAGNDAVYVFKPKEGAEAEQEGTFLKTLPAPKLEEPNGVTVDRASGEVYVADSVKGAIYTFSPAGAFEAKLNGAGSPNGTFHGKEDEEGNIAAVAVEESSGDIYVAEAERHVVSQYSASGEWLGWITTAASGPLVEPRGVALASSGDVYVGDALGAAVDMYGPGVVVPGVETGKASKLTRTTAMLGGIVNGAGKINKYHFDWGSSESLGFSTPVQSAGAGEEEVAGAVDELHAGTTYFFRLVAENENGVSYGLTHEFTTPPAVEGLSTGGIENLKPTSAMLTGSLTPGGFDTHYDFEWGTTTKYGNISPEPPSDAGSGAGAVAAETTLSGLKPNTTYHYRLVGTNSFGTTEGEDQKFTTSGPPRIMSEPTTHIGHEEATINAQVDPDELDTTYHFEYGETTAYGSEVPVGGQGIGSGATAVPVSASLTKLKLGVTYHFRVVASNENGETTTGPDQTFTTVPSAPVGATYATGVGASEATLHTEINPLGNDTTYYFQYGTESCQANPSGCTDVPTPPGTEIGSGETDVPGSVTLTGLQPQTTYYYRVLASNSLGTTEGKQQNFATKPGERRFALPDERAWEMVSPVNKHGAPIEALTKEGGLILAAEDGDSITYVSDGSIVEEPQGNRSPEQQQLISTRTPEGWSTQDVATPNATEQGVSAGDPPEYQFFTPDLSQALVEPWGDTPFSEPPLAPGATQQTVYMRDDTSGTYLPLVTEANVPAGTIFGERLHFVSATPDLSHAVLRSEVALTPPPSGKGLYEWAGGALQFVSLLPTGTPAPSAELGFDNHVVADAISSDGSRVIWTAKEENSGAGHLYMRDTATGETLQLDKAEGAPEPEKASAQFQAASSDDSRVFFTDRQRLTADSTAEPGELAPKADLYECEVTEVGGRLACNLKDLTVDEHEGEHAAVQGFVFGSSEDGSSVYLVAQGVLSEGENGNGETAEAGRDNLYELHLEGTQWKTTFIGVLSSEDGPEWEGNGKADPAFLTARVSPDGNYLAFMSEAELTGYDNVDANPEAKGAHDEEVYLYDSASSSLRCVSCNPTGARPNGVLDTEKAGEGLGLVVDRRLIWGLPGHEHWLAGNIPGWTALGISGALFQSRYLSDSGRLFFNSPDDLVAQATNGKEDVYEYEPSGVGSCESSSGGCVSLISAGAAEKESAFMEATPDGNDVFILTAAQLLPQDTDTAFDIYDARVCSAASSCLSPPTAAPPGCEDTEACRPASPAQQLAGGPGGTEASSGSGNVVAQGQPKHESKGFKATKPKALTRAQKLANALEICRKLHPHSRKKRQACEVHARKLYGPKIKAKKTARAKKASAGGSEGRGGR